MVAADIASGGGGHRSVSTVPMPTWNRAGVGWCRVRTEKELLRKHVNAGQLEAIPQPCPESHSTSAREPGERWRKEALSPLPCISKSSAAVGDGE
jgi:hypothetical protein